MAPLTRSRATDDRVPTPMMAEYYAQRASAGLIIAEATVISEQANGYKNTPGLFTDAQVAGWKLTTDAVHAKGGLIVSQFWHVGRVSDPELLGGETPVSASNVKQAGQVSLLRPKRDYVAPRPLDVAEIHAITEQYKQAAIRAKAAGFDGVELHAANGYLIDQFLQSKTNQREDEYGGSVENRARFLLEVTDALSEEREHLVFILWGNYAIAKRALIDPFKHLILTSVHPSPLSASRGFFGCHHFSKTNNYLIEHNIEPIDWKLD